MTRQEQTHVDSAYAHVKAALDELAQVLMKDKYLTHAQSIIYTLEDTLYQYISNPDKRRKIK